MILREGINEAAQPEREALDARVKGKVAAYGLIRSHEFAFVFPVGERPWSK